MFLLLKKTELKIGTPIGICILRRMKTNKKIWYNNIYLPLNYFLSAESKYCVDALGVICKKNLEKKGT